MDTNSDVRERLKNLSENGFGGSINETALALGRAADDVERMLSGDTSIDEDLEMKINGIAEDRGIAINA
jgi:hypothetical protein